MQAEVNTGSKSISLKPHLDRYLETLEGRERSRAKSAFGHLEGFLGPTVTVPNRALLGDLTHRFRVYLREAGLEQESIKNYTLWAARAVKWIASDVVELSGLGTLPAAFPVLAPDADDIQQRYWRAYRRFCLWCADNRTPLGELNRSVFRAYQRHLLDSNKYLTARNSYSALVTFWLARSNRWEIPAIHLPEMARKGPGHYGLKRSMWPTMVEADFRGFFRFSRGQEQIEGRVSRSFRDSSAEIGYARVLSTYLGYLANILRLDISQKGLRELIGDESLVLQFIEWHKAERANGTDANAHQVAFERFAVILDELWQDPIAATYREYVAQLDPVRKEPRFHETLVPFKELLQGAYRALEDACLAAKEAEESGDLKAMKSAAVGYHDALLFSFLILRPLRESNVLDLFMGVNLKQRPDGHHELVVPTAEEKGRKLYRIQFPKDLEPYLAEYLAKWRPLLNLKNDSRLFMTARGGRLTPKLLIDRTTRFGQRYLNIAHLNPHFFRALTVSSYLADYPNQFEMARQLLGHRSLSTTLKYYIHIHALHASRRAAQFARETCPEFQKLGDLFQNH